jgi:hypothetical protein
MAKKKAAAKKAAKKRTPAKKTARKKAAKKKAAPGRNRSASLTAVNRSEFGTPVCRTQRISLGDCMSWAEALLVIEAHERKHPTHVVDIESC